MRNVSLKYQRKIYFPFGKEAFENDINLTNVSFLCVRPVIDHEFRHKMVKEVMDPRVDSQVDPQTMSARDFCSYHKLIDCEISLL